ncbi:MULTISPECIES: VENN motif pre-toxin domain-containing protein [Citrobacter]|uniref:Possible hemagglutinin (DUF638) n=1 Tax=Citrobacter youngae TaxID=133448 RepID=A0A9Q7ZQS9_9ENTR|nr:MULTISPECIES: VENN motif pre-toxin domain-containing protein [Citrobacter]MDM2730367.1 VENN motif pre-toxin domain-containing protein [Citrobacter sp. Cy070]SUX80463.1 Possible hemagglutinin (DUF638) [Citrobacter youngae]
MGAALAGASAPELAHLLKSTEGNSAVNVIAHAILGGAVAAMQGNSAAAAAGAQAGKNAIENNALGDKDKLPVNIFDINPLKPNVLDTDGEPLKGGGGIGKFTINKGQQNKHLPGTNEYKIASEAGLNKSVLTLAPDSLLPKLGTSRRCSWF